MDKDVRDELRKALAQPDAPLLAGLGRKLERSGHLRAAATAYDAAFGLDPDDSGLADARSTLLDTLAVTEHGLVFRFVPAGTFLMGSERGDPDEQPKHTVELGAYWISDTPVTWSAYCALMGWSPPSEGGYPEADREGGSPDSLFYLAQENKIRYQYCRDALTLTPGGGEGYTTKPMVSVSHQSAEDLAERLSTDAVRYRLPTEAEWEKAARGGRVGALYAWGDEAPTPATCDFGHFGQFEIRPSRSLPPNGYRLYGMCGGVWEWTRDRYDACFYQESPRVDPCALPPGDRVGGEQRVLRGGSWSDCAEVCTVSFRMARESSSWRDGQWGGQHTPNVGFRLCRVEFAG